MEFMRFATIFLLLTHIPVHAAPDYEREVLPFLKQHCYSCHDAKKAKAGFRIDQLGRDFLSGTTADDWHEVINQINSGEMPPEDEPRPDAKAAFAVVEWVGGKLKEAEKQARMSGGRILMRRLNRQEFANTVGDLLRLDPHFVAKLKEELPADGKAEGFDRIGSALFFDQTQMLGYLDWAGQIAREAVQSAPPKAETYVYEAEKHLYRNEGPTTEVAQAIDHQIPLGPTFYDKKATGVEMWSGHGGKPDEDNKTWAMVPYGPRPDLTKLVTQDGYYRVRVHAGASPGARGTPVVMRLTYATGTPLESVHDITIQGTLEKPGVAEALLFLRAGQPDQQKPLVPTWNGINNLRVNNPEWGNVHLRWLVVQGKISKAVAARDDAEATRLRAEREQVLKDLDAFTGPKWIPHPTHNAATAPRLFLDKIEVEGPLPKEWPPASHKVLGLDDKTPQDENGLRSVFAGLLPRAYRRPVEKAEVDKLVRIAAGAMQREKMPFPDALRLGLQTMLCSPGFVFIQEPQPRTAAATKGTRPLNDFELASRLSYFLWSSLPDDALLALAAKGTLKQPATLRAQVTRMLADAKSRRFVENFAGQWLDVEQFGSVEPAKEYKGYDSALKVASREEPLAFFQQVLTENLPVAVFLHSDFLVINERLARHYGIEGVSGEAFQKVALKPEHHRGGVLGMAGLLTLLADGTRTLPVRRGAWVLEKLLNDPAPPPPPNAGDIQPNTAGKNLSVRERLQLHRNEPNCASCHAKLDPYGLALENYDAIGAWRERQNGEGMGGARAPVIDASGALKSGREFKDLHGYKAGLMAEQDKFIRAFTEKLLTYALGRPVGYVDHATIETILKSEPRLQSLVQVVVASEPFQTK
jgi:mono/diheme cytochrome c family protein